MCHNKKNIQSETLLSLYVQTKWNSTYIMLNITQKFERAFERYGEGDPHFYLELASKENLGVPNTGGLESQLGIWLLN